MQNDFESVQPASVTPAELTGVGPHQQGASTVAILLATYNGESFIAQQLMSFEQQTHPDWCVWASDDGSTDATLRLLADCSQRWGAGKLRVLQGPSRGSTQNFLSMVHNPVIQADYYAYSDQDDIWEADKLTRAVRWLSQQPHGKPALYCSRTRLVDEAGRELGVSPLFSRPPSFANALVQNITGGNTMVFNDAARKLLMAVPLEVPVVIHDWWTYMVVTGAGGGVYFDAWPSVRYRQHDGNLIGMSVDGPSLATRVGNLCSSLYRRNGDINIGALSHFRAWLSPDNARVFDLYANARRRWLLPRLVGVKRAGVYRLTLTGRLGLLAAVLLNKI